jgi:hypothetical protein
VRDEIRAPNGEKSILYEHIKAAIPNDYQPDAYVLTAFKLGEINGFSKEDIAFALWSKLHTKWLEKEMKKTGIPRDRNGEPLFAFVHERIGLSNVHERYLLSGPKGAAVFVKSLEARGFIERVSGFGFRVLGLELDAGHSASEVQRLESQVGEDKDLNPFAYEMEHSEEVENKDEMEIEVEEERRAAVEEHQFQIDYTLDWLGVPKGFVQYEEKGADMYVRFDPGLFQVSERMDDASENSNVRSLVGYLADRFPQLQIRFVTEEDARPLYETLDRPGRLPFDQVNSFVSKGGIVHLIEGRVNNMVAMEEVLHPFVHTIAATNKELFAQLLDAARADYEKLDKEIKNVYTDDAGFSHEDRDRELVTQALTSVYADEVEKNEAKSVRAVLPKLVDWLLQLVRKVGDLLRGKKQFLIRPQDLPSRMSLTDVAGLLNTYDSTFLIDPSTMNASFSLATEKEALQRQLLQQANSLQRKMIKDLMEPKEPVVYDAEQKAYVGASGEVYQSLKTAIDGEAEDAEGKEGLRSLFGIHANRVLEGLALGEEFSKVKDVVEGVDVQLAAKAYRALAEQLENLVTEDSVVVPNVVVGDYENDTAATLDLVVLDADGTMRLVHLRVSPDSVFDKVRYEQDRKKVGEDAQLAGESLSARQRHSIQVAGEKRLLENNGYEVDEAVSIYVHVPEATSNELRAASYQVKVEDTQVHGAFENRPFVNQIFPMAATNKTSKQQRFKKALGKGNPVRHRGFLRGDEAMPEEELEEPVDRATVREEAVPQDLTNLAAEIDKLMQAIQYQPKSPMVQKLSELVKFVRHDLSRGQGTWAYAHFLNKAYDEVDKILKYLSDGKNMTDHADYCRVAIEAQQYVKSYEGIMNAFHLLLGNDFHSKKLKLLERLLKALDSRIDLSLEQYILDKVRTVSNKELTEKDLKDIVREVIDISKEKYYFNDIDTSPDTLTAVMARTYKRQREKSADRMEAFQKKVKAKVNETAETIGGEIPVSSFMEADEHGPTGRPVQEIGPVYFRKLEALENKVRLGDGMLRQYREVHSLVNADPADIAYNKELFQHNDAIRKFKEPEEQTAKGFTDGMFHEYKEEFKQEREMFEEYVPVMKDGKFIKGIWKRKLEDKNGVPISDLAYNRFRNKYYQQVVYDKPVFERGAFTGVFIKYGGKRWVVKEEYIQIRKVAGDGTNMVSQQWLDLRNDTSPRGRALWSLYEFYVKELEGMMKLLPPNVQRNMFGKLPRLRANFIEQAKKSPSFFKALAKTVTGWFTTRSYAKAAIYNNDGTIANQIPIFFTGNLRNAEIVERLKAELTKLDQDYKDSKIARDTYLQQREEKSEELKAAEKAPSADELSTNLFESLIAFNAMVENYVHMNEIEGAMLAAERVMGKRMYKKMGRDGKPRKVKGTGKDYELKDGTQSWTYKRFKKFMEMVFYNSEDLDNSTFDVVIKKLMSASSLVNIGFNSFGAIHNYVMARINTVIESAGGLFYSPKAAKQSLLAFEKEFIPGYLSSMGKKDGYLLKTKRAGSKYEALVNLFRIYQKQQSGEHRINVTTPAFFIMEAGEYSAQTKSGIAYLMSHDLKNKFTNETTSIYDAFDFNAETGEVRLKPGFTLEDNTRYDITNSIREMNKQIHGSYRWEDRMVIQQEAIGQAAAQYHKWVYPMYKARFGKRYFDENLGWLEGRYRTVWHMFQYMYEEEGSILQKIKGGLKRLDAIQIKNMYKNAAELGFFVMAFAAICLFRAWASGDDDDDKKDQSRWLNFFRWESDRVHKEILFWIPGAGTWEQMRLLKNPFAVVPTIDQFLGVVSEGFKLAAPPYDGSSYYTKGPFEGELRFTKELGDVLPIWKDINKWRSFSQVTNFYIK